MAAAETPCTEEVPVDVPTEHPAEAEQTQQNQCVHVCVCAGGGVLHVVQYVVVDVCIRFSIWDQILPL